MRQNPAGHYLLLHILLYIRALSLLFKIIINNPQEKAYL